MPGSRQKKAAQPLPLVGVHTPQGSAETWGEADPECPLRQLLERFANRAAAAERRLTGRVTQFLDEVLAFDAEGLASHRRLVVRAVVRLREGDSPSHQMMTSSRRNGASMGSPSCRPLLNAASR